MRHLYNFVSHKYFPNTFLQRCVIVEITRFPLHGSDKDVLHTHARSLALFIRSRLIGSDLDQIVISLLPSKGKSTLIKPSIVSRTDLLFFFVSRSLSVLGERYSVLRRIFRISSSSSSFTL